MESHFAKCNLRGELQSAFNVITLEFWSDWCAIASDLLFAEPINLTIRAF
jgi:hypothetical protein